MMLELASWLYIISTAFWTLVGFVIFSWCLYAILKPIYFDMKKISDNEGYSFSHYWGKILWSSIVWKLNPFKKKGK